VLRKTNALRAWCARAYRNDMRAVGGKHRQAWRREEKESGGRQVLYNSAISMAK